MQVGRVMVRFFIVRLLSPSIVGDVCNTDIGARFFQCCDHFFLCYLEFIKGYGVDLFATMKPFGHFLNAVQPFQS